MNMCCNKQQNFLIKIQYTIENLCGIALAKLKKLAGDTFAKLGIIFSAEMVTGKQVQLSVLAGQHLAYTM